MWLAGVAGAIVSIALVGDWWGYLIGGLILLALLLGAVPYGRGLVRRLLEYPDLRRHATDLESRVQVLEDGISRLTDANALRYEQGVEEGKRQVIGGILATLTPAPTLVAISDRGGKLMLLASSASVETVRVGARFHIQSVELGESKGVVEVVSIDNERERIYLECVQRTVEDFWRGLQERVVVDPTPPPGYELARFVHTPPGALGRGGE